MEKYKDRIKNRMIFEAIGTFIFLPVAVYALIRYWNIDGVISGTPIKDFFGGVLNGLRGGVIVGFVLYLIVTFIKNMLAIRNEEKLKKLYVEENDERALAISEHSSQVTFNITVYIILIACVITGLYSAVISLTLLAVWIFIVLIRIITLGCYNKKL